MDYQVWTKEEYGELWDRQEVGDLPAAKRAVLEGAKAGKRVTMTVEVPFFLELKVGEPGGETKKPKLPAKRLTDRELEEAKDLETDPSQSEQD